MPCWRRRSYERTQRGSMVSCRQLQVWWSSRKVGGVLRQQWLGSGSSSGQEEYSQSKDSGSEDKSKSGRMWVLNFHDTLQEIILSFCGLQRTCMGSFSWSNMSCCCRRELLIHLKSVTSSLFCTTWMEQSWRSTRWNLATINAELGKLGWFHERIVLENSWAPGRR